MRKIFHRIFLAVNIFFAAALLLSYLSAHIDPENFAFPSFFGLAYPYILLINFIIAVVWAVNLKFEALISVFVIVLGWNHLTNYIKFTKPVNEKQGTFKVMSFNLRLFNYFETPKNAGTEKEILEFVRTVHPEIICFQELFITGNPAEKDQG